MNWRGLHAGVWRKMFDYACLGSQMAVQILRSDYQISEIHTFTFILMREQNTLLRPDRTDVAPSTQDFFAPSLLSVWTAGTVTCYQQASKLQRIYFQNRLHLLNLLGVVISHPPSPRTLGQKSLWLEEAQQFPLQQLIFPPIENSGNRRQSKDKQQHLKINKNPKCNRK